MLGRCSDIEELNGDAARGGAVVRVRAAALLAVVVLGFAWQTVHYFPPFRLHMSGAESASVVHKPEAGGFHVSSVAECLVCKLRGQISYSASHAVPEAVLSPAVELIRSGDFFGTATYLSSSIFSISARGPPASLLT